MNTYKELENELSIIYDFIVESAFLKTDNLNEQELPENFRTIYKSLIEANKLVDLKFISDNKESFKENLLLWTGLTKADIIENIIFELYANQIYRNAKLDKSKYITEAQFLRKYIEPQVRNECIEIEKEEDIEDKIRGRIKDKKRDNAKYYWNKYESVFFDKLSREDTILFWQKSTHYSNLFGDINSNSSEDRKYNFPDFQVPFYSAIACNYTAKNNSLTYFLNEDFEKVNFKGKRLSNSYCDFIKELVNFCDKNEKYKNISYYLIEKEFNPITIEMLVNIFFRYSLDDVPESKIASVIYRLFFISTANPMAFSNDKIFNIISKSHIEKEDESRGVPCTIEIRNIRFINEFYNILLSIANKLFNDKMKELINKDKETFLSIYNDKGEDIISSIEKLIDHMDKIPNTTDTLKSIMGLKKEINISISRVNRKLREIKKINESNDINELNQDNLLKLVYLKEDIDDLVHNNDMLRLLFRSHKYI